MTTRKVLLLILVGIPVAAIGWFFVSTIPPSEASVIKHFNKHRAQFEQLRTMIEADKKLVIVADWGVETTDSPGISEVPPHGSFPAERYHQYLSLLAAADLGPIVRMKTPQSETRVLVWASGFAGDTRHVAICWLEHAPANQVASLNLFYKTPKPRTPMYRHIDGNWYIWADW